jgi:hypothetical protein
MVVVNGRLTGAPTAQKRVFYQTVGLNKAPAFSGGFGLAGEPSDGPLSAISFWRVRGSRAFGDE